MIELVARILKLAERIYEDYHKAMTMLDIGMFPREILDEDADLPTDPIALLLRDREDIVTVEA
jgi:hypothetical protein